MGQNILCGNELFLYFQNFGRVYYFCFAVQSHFTSGSTPVHIEPSLTTLKPNLCISSNIVSFNIQSKYQGKPFATEFTP